jgi:predicted glycosyltransferase
MKILIDIGHPAHVHFFAQPVRLLKARGHDILVTSRKKDIALELLDEMGVKHVSLSSAKEGLLGFLRELIVRDLSLVRVIRQFRPERLAEIGGTFIAHAGAVTRVPSLVFYDTENAVLQNAITYPLASCVLVPRCYTGWLPKRRYVKYSGYHELSYLHPNYFQPDKQRAVENGLDPAQENYLIRIVSWKANHDIGERGWSLDLLEQIVTTLAKQGNVMISSEAPLAPPFEQMLYRGRLSDIHHVLAYSRLYLGESATMASEAAVLGVPAIYAAHTGRGYTDEQEARYGLVKNVRTLDWLLVKAALDEMLHHSESHWQAARTRLLKDTIDVAEYVADAIQTFPNVMHEYQNRQG